MENEQEILHGLRNGDRPAMGQLFDQLAPALFGLAIRLTRSEQQATQVVKAAFRQIWDQAASFDPAKQSLFDWAISITKRLAIEANSFSDQFDFGAYQASHNVGADLQAFTKNIDPKHLRIIDLAYLSGYSEPEIEEAMNIPVGTVDTRLRNALRELRKVSS